jgi:hypothetical protein
MITKNTKNIGESFGNISLFAHPIRELIFLREQLGEKWAAKMLRTREDARGGAAI